MCVQSTWSGSSTSGVAGSFAAASQAVIAFLVFIMILASIALGIAVHSFRRAGGVDLCGARLAVQPVIPKQTHMWAIVACYGGIWVLSLISFSIYADRGNAASQSSYTYSAGFAFDVLLWLATPPAIAYVYIVLSRYLPGPVPSLTGATAPGIAGYLAKLASPVCSPTLCIIAQTWFVLHVLSLQGAVEVSTTNPAVVAQAYPPAPVHPLPPAPSI